MIYTFYSFKGGVGRSMAMANVAELLYQRGLKVLAIDFDLEAPGLERYFDIPEAVSKPDDVLDRRGVIDLIWSYKKLRALPPPPDEQPPPSSSPGEPVKFPYPVEPLDNFIVPIYEENAKGGALSIMPAGRRGGDEFKTYAERVRSLDWDDFFANQSGIQFFDWFKDAAEAYVSPKPGSPGVVLIDSRTGVTEMSGVCTYQLADVVVMFVTPSQQNLDGTLRMAESLARANQVVEERKSRPLSLLFVPSRVERSEGEKLNKFAARFDDALGQLIRSQTPSPEFDGNAFDYLKIPYIPYYAYKEDVAVREPPDSAIASDLRKAFENLTVALAQVGPGKNPLRKAHQSEAPEEAPRFFADYAVACPTGEGEATASESIATDSDAPRSRVYIYCKKQNPHDFKIATQLAEALNRRHHVFVEEPCAAPSPDWARQVETELGNADYLIVLISATSVRSEMLEAVVATAARLADRHGQQRPAIVPVRLNYHEQFRYPLSAYLNHLSYALWQSPEDTPRLCRELSELVSGGSLAAAAPLLQPSAAASARFPSPLPAAQPRALESPDEGTMDPQSAFYVMRDSDHTALAAIKQRGVTITIKGPRQMGKSSLLIRTIDAAQEAGKRAVFLDFQLVGSANLASADRFFRHFCTWLVSELGLDLRLDDYLTGSLSHSQETTRLVARLLKEMGGDDDRSLVIGMDEVETIFDTDFRSDFFSMLRTWHNSRRTGSIWKKLDLVLVTSTEPYQLVANLNQSPFNVGEVIELEDFTPEQVADLNRRHGSPLDAEELRRLLSLIHGHPYMVRRALYLLASGRMSAAELFASAASDRGPFGDHLRNQLFRLHDKEELIQGLKEVIRYQTCHDELVFFRLRGAGLVRKEGRAVLPRCPLYATYFREHLYG